MRGGIPIRGTAAGTGPPGSSCRKEEDGEERRVPGAQSVSSGGFGVPAPGVMKVKRGAWWFNWDSISGKISLQSKCYMIRKHCPFLGWLNQNNLPIALSLSFSWLTALICIIMALSLCCDLVSSGLLKISDGNREPLGPCVPSFSKSSLLGAFS